MDKKKFIVGFGLLRGRCIGELALRKSVHLSIDFHAMKKENPFNGNYLIIIYDFTTSFYEVYGTVLI